jgi:hypothetical protein
MSGYIGASLLCLALIFAAVLGTLAIVSWRRR